MRLRQLVLPLLVTAACGGGTGDPGGESACVPGAAVACDCGEGRGAGISTCDDRGQPGECACPGAVSWSPRFLDFGEFAPGTPREAAIALSSDGDVPVPIRSVTLASDTDPRFQLVAVPAEVPSAGAVALVVVAFRSDRPAVADGALRIELAGRPQPIEIPLAARAAGPALVCDATAVDFGDQVLGVIARLPVTCRNESVIGTSFDGLLRSLRLESDDPEFAGVGTSTLVGPGEEVTFEIRYLPVDTQDDRATLRLVADGPLVELEATGSGVLADCALELPAAIALAGVPTEELAGEVVVRNLRDQAGCLVERIDLDPGCGGFAFDLPPGPTAILAGGALALPFTFTAGPEQGHRTCTVSVHTDSPVPGTFSTRVEVDLSWRPCLVVEGPTAFPAVSPSCGPTTVGAALANRCNRDFLLGELRFLAGSAPGFAVTGAPPPALAPGERWPLPIAFDPEDDGREPGPVTATLEVLSPLDPQPWRFPFTSERLEDDLQERMSLQPSGGPLDVLVVIDNGLDMAGEVPRILDELGPMPEKLFGYDYRLAVTTTGVVPATSGTCPGGAAGAENGRFVPVDGSRPRAVSPFTPDGRATWEANLQVGACHDGPARPFAAAVRALDDLARVYDDPTTYTVPDDGNAGLFPVGARPLLLVFVSDRDDASPGTPAEIWTALREARNYKDIDVVAIAGAPGTGCTGTAGESAAPGERLAALAALAQGTTESICAGPWNFLAPYDIEWALRDCFPVEGVPADRNRDGRIDAGDLVVRIAGQPVPPVAEDGTVNWRWDPEAGTVCFERAARPPPGVAVVVGSLSCGGEG